MRTQNVIGSVSKKDSWDSGHRMATIYYCRFGEGNARGNVDCYKVVTDGEAGEVGYRDLRSRLEQILVGASVDDVEPRWVLVWGQRLLAVDSEAAAAGR